MNIIIKRFIVFALSFTLVIVPSFAVYDPNPKHSKWFHDSIVNDPTVKSTVEVKAQRTYPVVVHDPETGSNNTINKTQKTKIKIPANVAKVGKKLLKGGAHAALGAAVYDILGRAVDWVLDPENNRVKYKDLGDPTKYIYKTNGIESTKSNTAEGSCALAQSIYGKPTENQTYQSVNTDDKGNIYCPVNGSGLSARGLPVSRTLGDAQPADWQYIYADELANKVIQHANEGKAPAMQVMADTALDALEAGELDNQLEAAAEPKQYGSNEYAPGTEPNPDPDPDPDPENPNPDPDPENPNPEPMPTEWPAFCDWAVPVCDFIEWVKAEPDQTDTEIDLQEPDEQPTDTNFDFGGSCPAPIVFEGSIFGQPIEFTMLDTVMLCDFLSTYVKWPVYAASSLFAIYIVGGRKEDG